MAFKSIGMFMFFSTCWFCISYCFSSKRWSIFCIRKFRWVRYNISLKEKGKWQKINKQIHERGFYFRHVRLWNIPDKRVVSWSLIPIQASSQIPVAEANLITAVNFCDDGRKVTVGTFDGRFLLYNNSLQYDVRRILLFFSLKIFFFV